MYLPNVDIKLKYNFSIEIRESYCFGTVLTVHPYLSNAVT